MSEIHALSGAYAIDALDADERALFDEHLATCAECRAEVASFRETAALMAETGLETPPDSLRSGVLDGIKNIRPLPPEVGQAEAGPAEPGRAEVAPSSDTTPMTEAAERHAAVLSLRGHRRWVTTLVAAAAAVVLLAVGVTAWHPWSSHQQTSIADRVLAAPDAVRVTEQLPGGAGQVTLVRSVSLRRAVMVGDHVAAPKAGTAYQIWLQQPGTGMVSAGLMSDTSDTTVLTGDAATAKAAAITVEPDTGSAHPTSPPIVLFPLATGSSSGA